MLAVAELFVGAPSATDPAEVLAPDDAEVVETPPPADADDQADEPDTFPRKVVEDLRKENGKYRQRAQQADTYAGRLHTELIKATGRLADPTDLQFDESRIDDPDALAAAVDDLLERKPHLTSRKPVGDIGQGNRGSSRNRSACSLYSKNALDAFAYGVCPDDGGGFGPLKKGLSALSLALRGGQLFVRGVTAVA